MLLKPFYILLLFAAGNMALAQPAANNRVATMETISQLIKDKLAPTFDSAGVLHLVDSIAKQGDAEITEYARYFSIYHKANLITDINARLQKLIKIGAEINDFKTPGVKALHKFWVGDFYFSQKQYSTGLNLMLQAKGELATIGFEKIPYTMQLLNTLATFYYNFNNYRQCLDYAKEANKYQHQQNEFGYLNTWGLAYQKLGIYDSAVLKFNESIDLAKAQKSKVWESIASGNKGRTLCLQGNFAEGIPLLYIDVVANAETESINSAISSLYIAEAYLQLNRLDSARYYTVLGKKIFCNHNAWNGDYFYRYKFCFYYYEIVAKSLEAAGNYKLAIRYTDTANTNEKKYKSQYDWQLLTSSEKRIQGIEYQQYITQIAAQKKAEQFQKIVLAIVLVALGIIALLIISRQTIKYKKEKLLAAEKETVLLLQQQKAEQELKNAQLQLADFILKISEKNALIEKISTELTAANTEAAITPEIKLHLQNLQQTVILTEADWLAFKKLFEQVWPGFFIHLQSQYADLSPAEQRLLALHKLAISPKEMANMLGISVDSLRKSRYRLRKKYPDMDLAAD